MLKKKLKILVIYEKLPLKNFQIKNYLSLDDWESENNIIDALGNLGHKVILHGIYDDISSFIKLVKKEKPHIVFNLCETFNQNRSLEPNISGLCELLNVPYTGADPLTLSLCKDKGLQKKILSYHQIKVPNFVILEKSTSTDILDQISFPAVVKLLTFEASEGICNNSYVRNKQSCLKRVKYLISKFKTKVIVEEFIDGSEVYISLIGQKSVDAYQPVELCFENYPDKKPRLATYRVKWDKTYRKKWGLKVVKWEQNKTQETILKNYCKNIFRILNLSGYVRFDLRIKTSNEIYFIEANPNPAIARTDEFFMSINLGGVGYEKMVEKILKLAIHKNNK